MRPTLLGILLLAPLAAGCFTYTPIEPTAVAPEMSVRVRMTTEASRRMEATRDPDTPIEGRVFEVDGSQFRLLPEVATGGSTAPVAFPFSDVRLVEQRQISQTKTWAIVGAGMVGAALIVLAIDDALFGSGGGGGPGEFSIFPRALVRIPFSP